MFFRGNKLILTRLKSGQYQFGRLIVRITLSANSKTPLAFCNGKKYSLKKFVSLFEVLLATHHIINNNDPFFQTSQIAQLPPSRAVTQSPQRQSLAQQTPNKFPPVRYQSCVYCFRYLSLSLLS